MDIHAPLEPVHSWRDIALHLGIITIGLFIALSLEGLVEYIQHRHLVHEARANIRQEIEDNHKAAQDDFIHLQKSIDLEKENIRSIHGLQHDQKNFHGSVNNSMSFEEMQDAAWRTARDTGALSFMSYTEVERYSDLYMHEDLVNNWAISVEQSELLAQAPFAMDEDPSQISADEYARVLQENATIEIRLVGLKQQVQQFDDLCVTDLKK